MAAHKTSKVSNFATNHHTDIILVSKYMFFDIPDTMDTFTKHYLHPKIKFQLNMSKILSKFNKIQRQSTSGVRKHELVFSNV